MRQQLGFESDLLYRGPFGNAFHPQPRSTDPTSGMPDDWMAQSLQITRVAKESIGIDHHVIVCGFGSG